MTSGHREGVIEAPSSVYLVRGDDPSVLSQAVRTLTQQLLGDRDPALVLEEHGGPAADDLDVGAIVDAFTTPPFLVDRRIVVVRDAGRLSAADAVRLVAALQDPPPSSVLVLVGGGGTIPQSLVKEAGRVGAVVDAAVGTGRDRSRWMAEQIRSGPVHLTPEAASRMTEHLGDDLGRLDGLLQMLAAAYGSESAVDLDDLIPFLGEAGAVPPWELTDAIDAGRTEASLVALGRMLGAGGRSAPEILGLLHRHYDQLLRLDGAEGNTPEEAAALLGVRSTFVAKKALTQSRRLGSEHIAQAIVLLAHADLDVKGRSAMPAKAVLEVLVARLSRLTRTVRGPRH